MAIVAGVISEHSASASPSWTASAAGWVRRWKNILCTASAKILITPPSRTKITCARWPPPRAKRWTDGRHLRATRSKPSRSIPPAPASFPWATTMQPLGRLLSVVRPPGQGEAAADHGGRARAKKLEAIDWCGGVYSPEWGFAKLLHWLRHNPDKRARVRHRASSTATWWRRRCAASPIREQVKRSVCAMGHKWMWNPTLGGLPPREFLSKVDPLLAGVREKLDGDTQTSDQIAGNCSPAVGREAWPASRAFRFRWARSTRTGTRSAPAAAKATW